MPLVAINMVNYVRENIQKLKERSQKLGDKQIMLLITSIENEFNKLHPPEKDVMPRKPPAGRGIYEESLKREILKVLKESLDED